MPLRPVCRALLSVHDKTGLVELAQGLRRHGVDLVSTGGTAAALRVAGLEVADVAAITGFPEMLDGRVKTLHPRIHGGLLAKRDDPLHSAALAEHDIRPIDLLVSNLYPFEAALAKGMRGAELIEEIDVGGPAMIRAAAKNQDGVAVLTDPADYSLLLAELDEAGGTRAPLRARLAAKAFARTAAYDATIAAALSPAQAEDARPLFAPVLDLAASLVQRLRYGENPHQAAALYQTAAGGGIASARQIQGKELSYNNLLDADAALRAVNDLADPACVIVKHANPCGAAVADTLATAVKRARATDPVSAFGGIVAVNRALDLGAVEALADLFLEVVIAPAVAPDAARHLSAKPSLRVLLAGPADSDAAPPLDLRSIAGGLLVQERDRGALGPEMLKAVTRRAPTPAEERDLLFAWAVARHVKSNAIVLARDGATVGIGMGQTSRVDAVALAARRMKAHGLDGPCVVASDAFFPFADGLVAAADAGATAAIQPGGSLRDAEVIAAADARGLAMLTTGMRHFRH